MDDKQYLKLALEEARKSVDQGGFPAGAVVVQDGNVISRGVSLGFLLSDPTGHAETVAMREACKILKTTNLKGATLYESLQACVMCFSVANWAGISRIVSASRKTNDMISKGYYEGTTDVSQVNKQNNRQIELVHIPELEEESLKIVKEWEERSRP